MGTLLRLQRGIRCAGVALLVWMSAATISVAQQAASLETTSLGSFLNRSEPDKDWIGDPLPTGALMRLGTERLQHPGSTNDMLLSPDQRTIVSLGSDFIIG